MVWCLEFNYVIVNEERENKWYDYYDMICRVVECYD